MKESQKVGLIAKLKLTQSVVLASAIKSTINTKLRARNQSEQENLVKLYSCNRILALV